MRRLALVSALLLTVPAALAQKADDKPAARDAATESPFVGTWDYVVSPPSGEETGTFTIVQEGEALGGTFVTDTTSPIDPFVMDGDRAAFSFKHPGAGVVAIRGTLTGDRFEGEAELVAEAEVAPFVATRQAGDAGADR